MLIYTMLRFGDTVEKLKRAKISAFLKFIL